MAHADDKQTVLSLWQSNYLNIRRATVAAKEYNRKVIVGVELYDVSIDRTNSLYPWVVEALKVVSECDKYSLNIWSIYNQETMLWVKNNLFAGNGINIEGMNEGMFIFSKEYSPVKPLLDINIDISSGFESSHWYWVYHLFRLSEAILCNRDTSSVGRIVAGPDKYSVQPTTVRTVNKIPVAKPVK